MEGVPDLSRGWCRTRAARELLGVAESTLYKWAAERRLKTTNLHGVRWWKVGAIFEALEASE